MRIRTGVALAAALLSFVALSPAQAAGVKIGVLSCRVHSGWGYVLGSSRDLDCTYHRTSGSDEHYTGTLMKVGVDIGYLNSGELVWGVVAPTSEVKEGALAGQYAGATGGATVGLGGDVHVLVGGLDKSIALQPVSIQGNSGLDVAAGIGAIELKQAA
jgi:Protein of unknown function (DUF992)